MMDGSFMRRVGISTPGGPGDIWVSEDLIAQRGIEYVLEQVRQTYEAAYRSRAKNFDFAAQAKREEPKQ